MRPDKYVVEVRAVGEMPGFPENEPVIGRYWVTRDFVDMVEERVLIAVLGEKVLRLLKL